MNDGGRYNPAAHRLGAITCLRRAGRSLEAHGGVDRQRDDRVGWLGGGTTAPYFHDTFSYTPAPSIELFLYQRP